jgi:hypothetical protein
MKRRRKPCLLAGGGNHGASPAAAPIPCLSVASSAPAPTATMSIWVNDPKIGDEVAAVPVADLGPNR